jgi:hypothetical protein
MSTFYSPTGNAEVWNKKPDGYYTPEEWATEHPAPVLSFDELKTAKYDEIAAARYAAETGGCTVDGVTIATDRGSQALLTAAVVTARLDLEFKTRWKCADGRFITLDAMQLRAIGDAVIAHVESCFAREAELCEQIDAAETAEDLAAIKWGD